jgi:site-specific DNA-methyltransferase (adenine-specific)
LSTNRSREGTTVRCETDSAGQGIAEDHLICCDNLVVLRELPAGACSLIYVDPPFGTGQRRKGAGPDVPAFDDPYAGGIEAFVEFLRPRLEQMHRVLSERGSLYLHLDWRTVHHVKVLLDTIFGRENFLNEIIWSYRTGGGCQRWFARKHDTLLLYAKRAGHHVFNVLREGEFRTRGLNVDEEGRPYKMTRRGRLYFHPDGPAMTDVWEIPFLSTVAKERNGYPSQKPEALLERIIRASSEEGDRVADFFCGSGTTLAVAKRLGRRYLGCDINPAAIEIAAQRTGPSVYGSASCHPTS